MLPKAMHIIVFASILGLSTAHAENDPPLIDAAKEGKIAEAKSLLENNTDPNTADQKGYTALNWAAYKGHLAIVEALVSRGADVNRNSNERRYTPLMNAAAIGNKQITSYLLRHGANAALEDLDGYAAISWSLEKGYDDVTRMIRDHILKYSNVHYGPNDAVLFINKLQVPISIKIDDSEPLSIEPGQRGMGRLGSGDANIKHPIKAVLGRSCSWTSPEKCPWWSDRVQISECHWNWNGIKTYTFIGNKIPFGCTK